jgi:hypothetical protein
MANGLAGDQSGELSIRLAAGTQPGDSLYLSFPVGIEGFGVSYPTRATVTQALDGMWLDSLGPGIMNFTISGHTGYKPQHKPSAGDNDGRQEFFRLVNIHKEHQRRCREAPNQLINLLVYTDVGSGFLFYCFATDLHVTRDKSSPTLFHFEWDLTVVKDQSPFLLGA